MILFSSQAQEKNYASFQDNKKRMWSVAFKTEQEFRKFAIHVALAKYITYANKSLVAQELTPKSKEKHVYLLNFKIFPTKILHAFL